MTSFVLAPDLADLIERAARTGLVDTFACCEGQIVVHRSFTRPLTDVVKAPVFQPPWLAFRTDDRLAARLAWAVREESLKKQLRFTWRLYSRLANLDREPNPPAGVPVFIGVYFVLAVEGLSRWWPPSRTSLRKDVLLLADLIENECAEFRYCPQPASTNRRRA